MWKKAVKDIEKESEQMYPFVEKQPTENLGDSQRESFVKGGKFALNNTWVSTKEELPECNEEGVSEYCLIRRFDGGMYVAYYDKYHDAWSEGRWSEWIDSITHWSPINPFYNGKNLFERDL